MIMSVGLRERLPVILGVMDPPETLNRSLK